jgi:hypothetical protein
MKLSVINTTISSTAAMQNFDEGHPSAGRFLSDFRVRRPASSRLPRRAPTAPVAKPAPCPMPPIRRPGNRELFGIVNHNGSCYFNCVFQILFHCIPFQQRVLAIEAPSDNTAWCLEVFSSAIWRESPRDCVAHELILAFGGRLGSRDAASGFRDRR